MKKTFIGILLLVVGLLSVFAAINFKDEPLDIAVAEILNKTYEYTPEQIAAYKYVLGITAPIGESVEALGEERYQKILSHINNPRDKMPELKMSHQFDPPELPADVCKNWCDKAQITSHSKEVAAYLGTIKPYLERANKLLEQNEYVNTLKPVMVNSPPVFAVFELLQLKILELQYKAYNEKSKAVIPELQRMQNYLVRSMSHPDSLISAVLRTAVLKNTLEFSFELRQDPHFKSLRLTTPIDVENLINGVVYFELNAVEDALKWDPMHLLGDSKDEELLTAKPSWYQAFLLQKNRTLNTQYRESLKSIAARCESAANCSNVTEYEPKWFEYVQNPMGKLFNKLFTSSSNTYAKMFLSLEKWNTEVSTLQK